MAGGLSGVGLVRFQAHGLGQPNSHGPLLRVAEHDILVARFQGGFKIEEALVLRPIVNAKGLLGRAQDDAIGCYPFVLRTNHA